MFLKSFFSWEWRAFQGKGKATLTLQPLLFEKNAREPRKRRCTPVSTGCVRKWAPPQQSYSHSSMALPFLFKLAARAQLDQTDASCRSLMKNARKPRKKARVFFFAKPLSSLERKEKRTKKSKENRKRKKQGSPKKQGNRGSGQLRRNIISWGGGLSLRESRPMCSLGGKFASKDV